MFRLGKRNFSLRDSPSKLSVRNSPATSLQASPLKRVRISNSLQLLSSTLLSECKQEESNHHESFLVPEQEKAPVISVSKLSSCSMAAETPPPTPDIKPKSKLESLIELKAKLNAESKELDEQIDRKMQEITEIRSEILSIRAQRMPFEDCKEVASRGQIILRDLLNQIYNPGTEMAKSAESFLKELASKHQRRLDKLNIELNNWMDQADKAIDQRKSSVEHEIELHKRTLDTRRGEAEKREEQIRAQNEEQVKIEQEAGKANSEIGDKPNSTIEFEDNVEDCVILEEDEQHPVEDKSLSGSVVNVDSSEAKDESKNDENVDDEDTDIDCSQGEEQGSFTPCQAQRPN